MVPFIDIHTHTAGKPNSVYNLKPDESPGNGWQSYGLHPWNILELNQSESHKLLTHFAQNHKIIAVGEIGIDRAIKTDLALQLDVFIQQHHIAQQFNLPVIIHCVKAYSDFMLLQKQLQPAIPWIFHGFNSNYDIAQKLIEKQCFLSFGAPLLENKKLQHIFTQISLDHIFLETDESIENIENIYQKAAELRQVHIDVLKETVFQNFNTVFQNR